MNIIKPVIEEIRKYLGQPVRLINLLANPAEAIVPINSMPDSIGLSSVIRWHELGQASYRGSIRRPLGELFGWAPDSIRGYGSLTIEWPEFEFLEHCTTVPRWTCDISDIHGFSASKSKLENFTSTDAMVEENSPSMISEFTLAKLQENLAHREIRIIHSPGSDYFCRYAWDGRVFLVNDGGSHHLAAAKYIASRLGESVPLSGKLEVRSLNASVIASLRRDFEMFVISFSPSFTYELQDALAEFKAPYFWQPLPRPVPPDGARTLYLPKDDEKSMRVAELLRQAGVFDLGEHLSELVERQQSFEMQINRRDTEAIESPSFSPAFS